MAFEIRLYKCSNDDNQVSKTFDNFFYAQYTGSYMFALGTLRTPTEILSPTIVIDKDGFKLKTASGTPSEVEMDVNIEWVFQTMNYAYIPIFNRYYFIVNYRVINERLLELQLRVDVLKTYDANIRSCSGFIERNENDFNNFLIDELRPLKNEKQSLPRTLPPTNYATSTLVKFDLPTESLVTPTKDSPKYIFVTCLISGTQIGALINYLMEQYPSVFPTVDSAENYLRGLNIFIDSSSSYIPNYGEENKLLWANAMCANTFYRITYVLTYFQYERLTVAIMNDDSIKTFIIGAVAMPISDPSKIVEVSAYQIPFFVKNARITDKLDVTLYVNFCRTGTLSKYVIHKRGDFPIVPSYFYDLEPYTRMEVFIPFCGKVEIPSSVLRKNEITTFALYYSVDLVNGECTAYFRFGTNWGSEFTRHGQMGVRLSLDSTNARELEAQMKSTAISASIGYLSSILSLGLGAVSGNPLPVVAGVTGIAKTTGSIASTTATMISRGSVSYDVSMASFYDAMEAYLIVTASEPLETGSTFLDRYRHLYGLPCRKAGTLSSLTGYTIVTQIHLDNFHATKTEKDEITTLLRNGVIL